MIPKKIHYCWYGKGPKNELIGRCMETWKNILHDYEIIEWNESNSPLSIPYCQSAYERKLWSKVANYVRLWAVYNEGGIYLDTDFEIMKSLDSFLYHDCFVAFQIEEEKPGWVTNGIYGATKGNEFVKRCMDKTISIFEEKSEFVISSRMTTMVLREMGLTNYGYQEIEGVAVYPADYFYPYSWLEEFNPACIKETTHAMHHWNKSWVKNK